MIEAALKTVLTLVLLGAATAYVCGWRRLRAAGYAPPIWRPASYVLGLGRFVPWVEVLGAAGGTGLKVPEIRSRFAFLLDGGVGASYFVTDWMSLYVGYRLQHISNGNTSQPNFGFESHTGVVGATFFLR